MKFLCGSDGHTLFILNSNLTRRLILSPWYQERWGRRFQLRLDQNTKAQFDNSAGGSRLATSVGGSLLGLGGDIIVVDDPHNTEFVESEAERENVLYWWRETPPPDETTETGRHRGHYAALARGGCVGNDPVHQ